MFLLVFAVFCVSWPLVDPTSNKIDCDTKPNNNSCNQVSCAETPCTMQCGLETHDQYDSCRQICLPSRCDALECRASEYCLQLCSLSNCGSLTCDAMACDQSCYLGNCSSLTCDKTSARCKQKSGSELTCEADACTQSCFREECRLTCPLGGANCTQEARESIADMKCDRNVCEQQCSFGQCNMNCSSSIMPGFCRQVCNFGTCEFTTSNAKQCIQVCQDAKCAMTCPREAKQCAQFGYVPLLGRITMKCDGVECQQSCYNGDCDMICPHGVSTCTQEAYDGNMTLRCEALRELTNVISSALKEIVNTNAMPKFVNILA